MLVIGNAASTEGNANTEDVSANPRCSKTHISRFTTCGIFVTTESGIADNIFFQIAKNRASADASGNVKLVLYKDHHG